MALNYFYFTIKSEPLVGKTLTEIESEVAKQTKKCDIVSFKTFTSDNFLPTSEEYLKRRFEFTFGINVTFTYSNSP